jgi:type I site-specific restriction-modification system R (restriction) subunit
MKVIKEVNSFLDYYNAKPEPLKRSLKDAQTVKKRPAWHTQGSGKTFTIFWICFFCIFVKNTIYAI